MIWDQIGTSRVSGHVGDRPGRPQDRGMTTRTLPALIPSLALGLAAAGLSLVPSAAVAAPASGHVTSAVTLPYSGNCTINGSDAQRTANFGTATGKRKATASATYEGVEPGTANVSFNANGTSSTGAVAKAKGRTFSRAEISGSHLASLTKLAAWDCDAEVLLDSQSGTRIRLRERGRLVVSWSRSSTGRIGEIDLTGPGGATVLDFVPTKARGSRTVRVRPGSYYLFAQFVTSIAESEVPLGETGQRRATYTVTVRPGG